MREKLTLIIAVILSAAFGFLAGKLQLNPEKDTQIIETAPQPEISLVQLKKITGDSIETNISGPVRILWGGEKLVEGDGIYQIPIPQIPTENDLKLKKFPYVGNANTNKFYPSTSQFARCTAVENRRFFETKETAIEAGFIPSKTVK